MNTMAFRTIAAALLVLSINGLASANYSFSLVGVTLTTGNTGTGNPAGTLTGTFTTDNSLSVVLSANIVASASGSYPGFDYTYGISGANSTVSSSLPTQFFELDTGGGDSVRIYFSNTNFLTPTGAPILTGGFSYEFEAGNLRTVSAGSVAPSAVPEPASIALTSSALAIALGGTWARRRRVGIARRRTA